ncbi:hypothetical protein ACF0H5_007410 [Mactra antiquata]
MLSHTKHISVEVDPEKKGRGFETAGWVCRRLVCLWSKLSSFRVIFIKPGQNICHKNSSDLVDSLANLFRKLVFRPLNYMMGLFCDILTSCFLHFEIVAGDNFTAGPTVVYDIL